MRVVEDAVPYKASPFSDLRPRSALCTLIGKFFLSVDIYLYEEYNRIEYILIAVCCGRQPLPYILNDFFRRNYDRFQR